MQSPVHFLAGRFSSSAIHSKSCLTTGLSSRPLAFSMAFASSVDSLANCGALKTLVCNVD
jgi:hypothetical protein